LGVKCEDGGGETGGGSVIFGRKRLWSPLGSLKGKGTTRRDYVTKGKGRKKPQMAWGKRKKKKKKSEEEKGEIRQGRREKRRKEVRHEMSRRRCKGG